MLTKDEQIFFIRAADDFAKFIAEGVEPKAALEQACRNVLARDEALWLTATGAYGKEKAAPIQEALCDAVYRGARKQQAAA